MRIKCIIGMIILKSTTMHTVFPSGLMESALILQFFAVYSGKLHYLTTKSRYSTS